VTPLPPKIELALGYLGGTEANRIREYIADLQIRLLAAESAANQALQEMRTLRTNRDHLRDLAEQHCRQISELLY
jgi:chromosome segregation ATPase